MPDRTNKCNKVHIHLLEWYVAPTLENFLTEEIVQKNIDFDQVCWMVTEARLLTQNIPGKEGEEKNKEVD